MNTGTILFRKLSESVAKLRQLFCYCDNFCDILNRARKKNHNLLMPYTEERYSDGLTLIEDKMHEISEKTLADSGLTASVLDKFM